MPGTAQGWQGINQHSSNSVPGSQQDFFCRPRFDDTPLVHDSYSIRHLGNDPKVMGDEKVAQPIAIPEGL